MFECLWYINFALYARHTAVNKTKPLMMWNLFSNGRDKE